MMKTVRHILLSALVLASLAVSCMQPENLVPVTPGPISDDALVFSPQVLGITPATKSTPGDADRAENTVTRLDVFVYKTTGGTSTFHKHYLIGDGSEAIATNVDYMLESNWRTNYTTTDTYRIYAVANVNADKLRNPVFPDAPTEAELQRLTSESKETIGTLYNTCYDIVRLVDKTGKAPVDGDYRNHHIGRDGENGKRFMMDGRVDNWQVNQSQSRQYFTDNAGLSFNLSRAAAKFRVTLDFSDEFKASLGTADANNLKFTRVTEYYYTEDEDTGERVQGNKKTERIVVFGSLVKNADGKVYADCDVEGGALVKFANILKSTYNVAPQGKTATSVPTAAEQDAFRDENLWESQDFYNFSYRTLRDANDPSKGYKYPYVDTTYSYAFSWDDGQAAEKAPALAISMVYTTYIQKYNADGSFDGEAVSDGGVTNYYRIPLVDITKTGADAINSIERNYYYQVDALINTMGTSSTEIEPMKLKLNYRVIPWPYAPNEVTEAQSAQLQYFVAETSYRLRGDGAASTQLQYFTPKSDPIAEGSQYNNATPKIRNVKIYYIDQDGNERVLATSTPAFNAEGGYTWSTTTGGAVSISVVPARDKKGGGDFVVSSTSLANRSVRYIEFDAYVDFDYDGGTVMERHFVVTHFPLDNIQSIPGAWSSRWDGQPASGSTTTYYRKKFYKIVASTTEIVSQSAWAAGVGNNNDDRRNANSAATAVNGYYATGGSQSTEYYRAYSYGWRDIVSIESYSWNGTTVTFEGTRVSGLGGTTDTEWNFDIYDYVVSHTVNNGYAVIDLWKYNNYYHLIETREESYSPTGDDGSWTSYDGFEWEVCTQAQYNATAEENRKYETVKDNPGSGKWVDWSRDEGKTYNTANAKYTYDGSAYQAKVYYNGRVYPINVTRSGGQGNRSYTYNRSTSYNNSDNWSCYWTDGTWASQYSTMDLTNNHMYIIQISKAESGVILGRPRLNDAYQSQDNVVSPAFMIASQLGAVSTFDSGSDAATHCHTYMEVAENGYRFVGWRLPTASELAYIVGYQGNEDITSSGVFEPVITGISYYTLDGQVTNTNYPGATGYNRVRCIRDLTPAEVIELNETGTITPASY